jgi:hypothetical protein
MPYTKAIPPFHPFKCSYSEIRQFMLNFGGFVTPEQMDILNR